jgi:hypothetical protein
LRGIEEEASTSQSLSRDPKARDRFRDSVSPVGYPRRKTLGEDGRGLSKEGSTKSPREIEISTKENSNHHEEDLGTECSSWERERNQVWNCSRERKSWVTGVFIDRRNRSDQYEKLV